MSAITSPTPRPGQNEPPEQPQPVAGAPKRPARWLPWAIAVILCGILWVAYRYLTRPQAAPQAGAAAVRTARVVSGVLERSMRLTGQTVARDYAPISLPMLRGPEFRQLTLTKLAKSGSLVKKGDVVAEIDPQNVKDHLDDVLDSLLQAENDIAKRKAEQELEWVNIQQTLRLAKSELDKMKLEAAAAEIRTVIDQELLKLGVEEAEAQYKQLEADLAPIKARHAADMRMADISLRRQLIHRDRHMADIKAFTMHSPMDGMAVAQPFYRNGELAQIQEGDDVGPGTTFMKVVNPNSMQVEASANQAQSSELRVGQDAVVYLDAFPGLTFKGKVHSIGAMGVGGGRENYYVRNVPVKVNILGGDPRLIPDLSAAANIILDRQENATLVPLGAVHEEAGKTVVFVKQGTGFARREIQIGRRNHTHAAVLEGLKVGEEVALEQPAAILASR